MCDTLTHERVQTENQTTSLLIRLPDSNNQNDQKIRGEARGEES